MDLLDGLPFPLSKLSGVEDDEGDSTYIEVPENIGEPWNKSAELKEFFGKMFATKSHSSREEIKRLQFCQDWLIKMIVRMSGYPFKIEIETTRKLVSASLVDIKKETQDFNLSVLFADAVNTFCHVIKYYEVSEGSKQPNVISRTMRTSPLSRERIVSLGIPEWILDLRHESCHGTTPPLSLLRKASIICLAWLKVNFWAKKIEETRRPTYGEVAGILSAFLEEPNEKKVRTQVNRTVDEDTNLYSVAYFMVDMEIVLNNENTIPNNVFYQFCPILNAIHSNGTIHILLHKLIGWFDTKPASIGWFKSILKHMTDRKEGQDFFPSDKLHKRHRPELYVKKEIRSRDSYKVLIKKLLNHMIQKPVKASHELLALFEKLMPGLIEYQKLMGLSSVYLGIQEEVVKNVQNVYQLKTEKINNIKTIEELKRVLAERQNLNHDKKRPMIDPDNGSTLKGILRKKSKYGN